MNPFDIDKPSEDIDMEAMYRPYRRVIPFAVGFLACAVVISFIRGSQYGEIPLYPLQLVLLLATSITALFSRVKGLIQYFPIAYYFMAVTFVAVPTYIGSVSVYSGEPLLAATLLFFMFSITLSICRRTFIYLYCIYGVGAEAILLSNSKVISNFPMVFMFISVSSAVVMLTSLAFKANEASLRETIRQKVEKETWIRLIGRVNHEINNPLAILAGYNHMLKMIVKRIDDEKLYKEVAQIIERSQVAIERITKCQKVLHASSEESQVRKKILEDEYHYIEEMDRKRVS